jgi:peptidoglycan hydrolase CwlO-like protein
MAEIETNLYRSNRHTVFTRSARDACERWACIRISYSHDTLTKMEAKHDELQREVDSLLNKVRKFWDGCE